MPTVIGPVLATHLSATARAAAELNLALRDQSEDVPTDPLARRALALKTMKFVVEARAALAAAEHLEERLLRP